MMLIKSQLLRSWTLYMGLLRRVLRRRKGMCFQHGRWLMFSYLWLLTMMRCSFLRGQIWRSWVGFLCRRTYWKTWMWYWISNLMPCLLEGWVYWLRLGVWRPRRRSLTSKGSQLPSNMYIQSSLWSLIVTTLSLVSSRSGQSKIMQELVIFCDFCTFEGITFVFI